ncbi:transcription antitermination factor NusB [Chloroflexota bacterium]
MAHVRRKARIAALQTLYESDCSNHDTEKSLSWLREEYNLPEDVLGYAGELAYGILKNRGRIDAVIQAHAPVFPLEQLSAIDRNILRLAIFEISIDNRVPPKAAINEAVELAKAFGSNNSQKFINGVLGTVSTMSESSAKGGDSNKFISRRR